MEKIALLFPGQGSQYVGMSKTLVEQYSLARQTFEEADDRLGFSLTKLCLEGSLLQLAKIENALPALLTASVAAYRVYMQEVGIIPQFLAGHSLGEYSALTCAEAIRFGDAVRLVQKRGQLAQAVADTGTGGMSILSGVNPAQIAEFCRKIAQEDRQIVTLSCYNSSNEVAVSGDVEAVQQVEDFALDAGAQVAPLIGTAPFHSARMQPAVEELRAELSRIEFGPIKWPVIANLTGQLYAGPDTIVDMLTRQLVEPVQWQRTIHYLQRQGVTMTIELGAKNVLSNLLRTDWSDVQTLSFDHKEDRRLLIEDYAMRPTYRRHRQTVVTKCLAVAVSTPNATFDNDRYQRGVVEPYRRIQKIQDQLEAQQTAPTPDQMQEALNLLKIILDTKQVPEGEQKEWFYHIFEETGTHYQFPGFLSA